MKIVKTEAHHYKNNGQFLDMKRRKLAGHETTKTIFFLTKFVIFSCFDAIWTLVNFDATWTLVNLHIKYWNPDTFCMKI